MTPVLGLMPGTMETKGIDSLDEVALRLEEEIKRYESMLKVDRLRKMKAEFEEFSLEETYLRTKRLLGNNRGIT